MFGIGMGTMGALKGGNSLFRKIRKIFAAGQNGAWYNYALFNQEYQDSTGTIPVTAVEQPLGLVLDGKTGYARGAELVTNGTFETDTSGWTSINSILSVNAGKLRITNTAANGGAISTAFTTVIGKTYKASAEFTRFANNGVLSITNSSGGGSSYASVLGAASGTLVVYFVATATVTYIVPYINAGVATNIADFDNISVNVAEGNHLTQATAAARPLLSARVNLLSQTENLSTWAGYVAGSSSVIPNYFQGSAGLSVYADPVGLGDSPSTEGVVPVVPNMPVASTFVIDLATVSGVLVHAVLGFISGGGTAYQRFTVSLAGVVAVSTAVGVTDSSITAKKLYGTVWQVNATTTFTAANTSLRSYVTGSALTACVLGRMQLSIGASTAAYQRVGSNNLLSYTEQFDNAVWNKNFAGGNGVIVPNVVISPDGTLTGDEGYSAVGVSLAGQAFTATSGVTYTFSVYVQGKAASSDTVCAIYAIGTGLNNYGSSVGVSVGAWTRITRTITATANGTITIGPRLSATAGAGNGCYLWGAQLEVGATATPYQRVAVAPDYNTTGFPTYAKFDGVDDSMTNTTGGGATSGFFWCGAVKPLGGAGTFRYVFADQSGNSGYAVALDTVDKLRFYAGNGAAMTITPAAITPCTVGGTYLLTVWDDGVNINAQLNSGAVDSIARPAVVAGTTSATLGKNNTSAANYFNGNIYPSIYRTGTPLTAAERAAAQAWCKSKAGL